MPDDELDPTENADELDAEPLDDESEGEQPKGEDTSGGDETEDTGAEGQTDDENEQDGPAAVDPAPKSEDTPAEDNGEDKGDEPQLYSYRGMEFAVAPDGHSLYEPALEDPESDEAQAVIAQIGEAAYFDMRARYALACDKFDTEVAAQELGHAAAAHDTLKGQITGIMAQAKTWVPDNPAVGEQIIQHFSPSANEQIKTYRDTLISDFEGRGFPKARAQALADIELAKKPDLVQNALLLAISNSPNGMADFVKLARGEGVPAAAPATKSGGKRPTPNVPPGIGASGGIGRGAAQAAKQNVIVPTEDEIAVANVMKIDPQKLAQSRRGK